MKVVVNKHKKIMNINKIYNKTTSQTTDGKVGINIQVMMQIII